MRVIYKHPVIVGAADKIMATEGAEFVHLDEQHGQLVAWVEHDLEFGPADIGYRVFATGEYVSPPVGFAAEHRFTAVTQGGFVWHLYRIWEVKTHELHDGR